MCKKVTMEQFGKLQRYRVDFLKVLVTTWKTQNLRVTTWNFPIINVHENLSKGLHIILLYMRVSHKNFKSKIVRLVFILLPPFPNEVPKRNVHENLRK